MTSERFVAEDLLPDTDAGWAPVTAGAGASVFRDDASSRYAKVVPAGKTEALAAERDRIRWLDEAGVPTASVLEWNATDAGACLVTSAVAGVPVDLHDVAPWRILDWVDRETQQRLEQERRASVVCHGDLCLPTWSDEASAREADRVPADRLGAGRPHSMVLTTRAGTPATIVRAGTSRVTTEPAATTAPAPIVTPWVTTAAAPIQTSSSITIGALTVYSRRSANGNGCPPVMRLTRGAIMTLSPIVMPPPSMKVHPWFTKTFSPNVVAKPCSV